MPVVTHPDNLVSDHTGSQQFLITTNFITDNFILRKFLTLQSKTLDNFSPCIHMARNITLKVLKGKGNEL